MRRWAFFLGVLLSLAGLGRTSWASTAEQCVSFDLKNTNGLSSPILHVAPFNAPWTAWLGTMHGTGASVGVYGYGPCLDRGTTPATKEATCHRGPAFLLDTLSVGKTAIGGPGPIEAVQFTQTTGCGGATCTGGSNENAACSANSECPAATCGPCDTVAVLCGKNQGGQP